MAKDMDTFRRKLEKVPGITITLGGRGHYKVYLHGYLITTLAVSSSDVRAVRQAITCLRKHGVEVPR